MSATVSSTRMGLGFALVAAVLLASAGPALCARKAFLPELEKSVEHPGVAGRRSLQSKEEIIAVADYDVIEVTDSWWMDNIGGYGGYGIYGYYGGFYGVYGTMDGKPFLDYDISLYEDLIEADVTKEEWETGGDINLPMGHRRRLQSRGDTTHLDSDYSIGPSVQTGENSWDVPWATLDVELDYDVRDVNFEKGTYGMYLGLGYGYYYGTVGYYGTYNDEYIPSIAELMDAFDQAKAITHEVAVEDAHYELQKDIEQGKLTWVKP